MNMNFTQSFDEFSRSLSTMDLALYAGIGLIVWVLFKDKLSPVQSFLSSITNKLTSSKELSSVPQLIKSTETQHKKVDKFFDLIVSWKQTRDLAELSGCSEAVKAIDQLFPYLSPKSCISKESLNETNK